MRNVVKIATTFKETLGQPSMMHRRAVSMDRSETLVYFVVPQPWLWQVIAISTPDYSAFAPGRLASL
jgi:hypothetical protein